MGPDCSWKWFPPFIHWINCEKIDCGAIHCDGDDCFKNPDCTKDDKKCIPDICIGPKCSFTIHKPHCNEENLWCFPA